MTDSSTRKKIAILGGGPSALAAAFALTSAPGWQDKYDITLYQLGWRLGGKCATGRGENKRIEEHGWHVWFGCYENAFALMRQAYAELQRAPGENFTTWLDAFKEQPFSVQEEYFNQQWMSIPTTAASNAELPGEGKELLPVWAYLEMAFEMLVDSFMECQKQGAFATSAKTPTARPGWWGNLLGHMEQDAAFVALGATGQAVRASHEVVKLISQAPEAHAEHHDILVSLLDDYLKLLHAEIGPKINTDFKLYDLWCVSDLICTLVRGVIADDIAHKGFNSINDLDFVAWLKKNGLQISGDYRQIRGLYDAVFAYENGATANLAAGTALHTLLRMTLTYQGAPLFEMQAGMGETVITPFYLVLLRRGVQIKFFHRVKNLGLSADKKSIATIQVGRQATIKDHNNYKPLIDVKGMGCWPSEPLYDQLEEGDELKAKGVNLESYWADWKDVETLTLKTGEDFDQVILGISIGALPFICPELIQASEAWQNMIKYVKTVETQAAQFWFIPTVNEMGWPLQRPIFTDYAEPLNCWVDVSHIIPWEDWPINNRPGCLFYLLSAALSSYDVAPIDNPNYPKEQDARFRQVLIDYVGKYTQNLLPYATTKENPTGLNWNLLIAPDNAQGLDRLNYQYLRVNYEPTERYVLSLAGADQYRLKTDQTGFSNLFIVGDWINTGINLGCVEVAVMSGMQASRAIAGYPKTVIGENGF